MKKSEFKNIVSEKIKIALSSNKKPIKEVFEIHDWFDNKIDQAHDWYRKKKGYDNLTNSEKLGLHALIRKCGNIEGRYIG